MGYKVTNKNVLINKKKNIAMDNIFYFRTKKSAEEYAEACKAYAASCGVDKGVIVEECSEAENQKYVFDQYHETYNANDMKVPNVVIERPIEILPGVPYWVTKRELLIQHP